ncbi:MAG: VOC family protein [Pseudomonadota bacterium]
MITVRNIDHIVLRVRDVERMIGFYSEVLGCPLERKLESFGLYQLRAGNALIDLVDVASEAGRPGGAAPGAEGRNLDHFCLRLEPFDPDALIAHLKSHGLDPGTFKQRYGAEGDGPSLYIEDPEGNTIELKGPPATPGVAAP